MNNKDTKIIFAAGTAVTALLAAICFFINTICGVLCALCGIALTVLFCFFTAKRYRKLCELNNYLSAVCCGNYNLDIADNTEGELSILKNNLFKVVTILQSQNEQLSRDKMQLAKSMADISHQLKTPLTSLMLLNDLLSCKKDESKRTEFAKASETQLDKISWLISGLLKISKIDSGTVEFEKAPVLMSKIVIDSLKPFLIMSELKNITVKNQVENCIVKCDCRWTEEAIQNIIKNCLEHTPPGGTLTLKSKTTSVFTSLTISDTGSGIPEDDLPHIFERFYRGKNSSEDSVGIGLSLSKTILEKQRASVSVKSKPNEGSEFEIKFYKMII